MTVISHEDLVEVLRVYAVVNDKPNLIKLIMNELSINDYLKSVLNRQMARLPNLEADVLAEEQKLKLVTEEDAIKHRTKMLEISKNKLYENRELIRVINNELSQQSHESESKN